MRRGLVTITILVGAAAPAHADPCADARAEVKKKDWVRASIDASVCGDDALVADVEKRALAAGYSAVDVLTDPDGATVVVENAPDRPFTTPRRVWMSAGRYTVTALMDGQPMVETLAVVNEGNDARVFLALPPPPDASADGTVDMGEEGGGEMKIGPPPKQEMPSLLPEKYQRGVDAPAVWDHDAPPPRPRGLLIAAGIATAGPVHDQGPAVSAFVSMPLGHTAWLATPTLGGAVIRKGDRTLGMVDAGLMIERRFAFRRADYYWGVGPGAALVGGEDSARGLSMGLVGESLFSMPSGLALGLRTTVGLLTTAEERAYSFALVGGRRW